MSKKYDDVVFLIGPIGAGKSLLSSELGKRNKLPVISTDLMRHCPKSLDEISNELTKISEEIKNDEKMLSKYKELKIYDEYKEKLSKLYNEKKIVERQFEMRKLLPNLPNYEDFGFDENASNFLREKFGIVAWHFYQKQFENQTLQALTEQIDFACIVDLGGGLSISLDKQYETLDNQFSKLDKNLYSKYIDKSKIGFEHIEKALEPFENVIELKLPDNYSKMNKAKNDELNDLFISSGQYDQLAKHTIYVQGIVQEDKVNWNVVNSLCNEIESKCNLKSKEITL